MNQRLEMRVMKATIARSSMVIAGREAASGVSPKRRSTALLPSQSMRFIETWKRASTMLPRM